MGVLINYMPAEKISLKKRQKKWKNLSEELIHQFVPVVFFDEVSFAFALAHNSRLEGGFVFQNKCSQSLRWFGHRTGGDFFKFRYLIKFNFVHILGLLQKHREADLWFGLPLTVLAHYWGYITSFKDGGSSTIASNIFWIRKSVSWSLSVL